MEYVSIILVAIASIAILFPILQINIKKVKELGENKELNALANNFPENIEITGKILEKLQNKEVTIKEDNQSKTSLYMVANNTILVGNIRDNFTRVQTIAHECAHSVQNKKMLWFNFIFTNVYLVYFLIISIFTIINLIENPMPYLSILILLGVIQYFIRSLLETEAMIKAKYIAKEYLEENQVCSKEQIEKLVLQYEKMNQIGIHFVNYQILVNNLIKVIIFAIICVVF